MSISVYAGAMRAHALALAILLAGCSPGARLSNAWLSPTYQGPPFHTILVVGETADGAMRRTFEDSFAAELNRRGVRAIPSYTVIPGNDAAPTPQALRAAADRAGAEGVLTTRILRVEQKTETTPGFVRSVPVWGYPGGFYGYYGYYYRNVLVRTPTIRTYSVAQLETELWSLRGNNDLVWTADSEAVSPNDAARVGTRLAISVADDLQSAGLITAPAPS